MESVVGNQTFIFLLNFDINVIILGNALDDLILEDSLGLSSALDRDSESPGVSNSISVGLASSAGLLGSSAPVNIPNARSGLVSGFSPTSNSPLQPFLNATR